MAMLAEMETKVITEQMLMTGEERKDGADEDDGDDGSDGKDGEDSADGAEG